MSEYFAPSSNASFNTENITSNSDTNVSLERLQEEFANKFNSRLFQDCEVDGSLSISENLSLNTIQGLNNENISFNNNIDLKHNNIYFNGETTYASKIQKKEYIINGNSLNIPISAKDDQNVYLVNISRSDGIYDFANNCPLFVSYLLLSQISYVKPVPIISNLVDSFSYSMENGVLTLVFSKEFTDLHVNVAISQLQ